MLTSNSSTSLIVMLNDWLATDPSLLAASTVIERVAAVRFTIDRRGGGDHSGVGIDREQPVGVAGQAVGDRVVGRIQSKASAVMPTVVPMTTFSVTSSVAASESVGTLTSNSSTSLIVMLNDWLATDPSLLAASTVIERVAAVRFTIDRRGGGDHAGVGIDGEQPVGVAGQAVGDRVVGRVQVEGSAVMPTVVPMTTFSVTSLVAASESVGTLTSNSSTSLIVMLNDLAGDRTVAAGRLDRDRASCAVRFTIDRRGGSDHTGVGIDREQPVGVAGQAVGDRVVGRVQIEGIGRDPDGGADDHVFGHFVGRGIGIGRYADIELVDIVDRDVERLGWRPIRRCWPPRP